MGTNEAIQNLLKENRTALLQADIATASAFSSKMEHNWPGSLPMRSQLTPWKKWVIALIQVKLLHWSRQKLGSVCCRISFSYPSTGT